MYAVNFVWQKIIFQFYNQGEMKYKEFIVFILFNTEKKFELIFMLCFCEAKLMSLYSPKTCSFVLIRPKTDRYCNTCYSRH